MDKIPLRNKKREIIDYALISPEDFEELNKHRWGRDAQGYAVSAFYIDRKTINVKMHRLIMDAPKGLEVDHINRKRLDNTRQNLRICTRRENSINVMARSNNISGHKGIGWDKSRNKWRAQIKIDGKNVFIGRFDDLKDAIKAYLAVARKVYGEFLPRELA